ncbi:MAG: Crp/Fnr family transcriptional regulator [Lachnospiraceae bacterium]|nr:Crp/Fnr family transcriptional regulator [Lachnospiraceae bacterium]
MKTVKFSNEEMEKLSKAGYQRCIARNDIIYLEGDAANTLCIIRSGRVRVLLANPEGEELTVEIVEKGRLFGESSFQSRSVRPTTVKAVTDVVLICCTIDQLLPCLCRNPEILMKVLQHCSGTMNHLSYVLHSCRFMNRYQRIASFLLEETDTDNPDKDIAEHCLPYSHEEIAMCLGMARPTVSQVLKAFEREGWVRCAYRKVYVLDQEGLAGIGQNEKYILR